MSFNQKNFGPIGGENMVAPAQWSYRTGDDDIAEVSAAGYFNDKVYQLESGDNIYIAASDSVGLYEIVNDGEQITLTSITSGGGVQTVAGDGVGGSAENVVMSFPDADEVIDASTVNKFVTAAEKASIGTALQSGDNVSQLNNDAGYLSSVTAEDVGLGNVDNTSDADKPISTATQSALDTNEAAIQSLDTYIEYGRRSAITPDVPLVIDGLANQFETIDTYTFSVANADTYKISVIIPWRLNSAQQKALFEFELDSTVILEATLEPKDSQNDDFLFVFGLRDLTAGSHTLVAKGTKTNDATVLTIDGCSWTRNRIILDT